MTNLRIVMPDAESAEEAATFHRLFEALAAEGVSLTVHVGAPSTDEEWEERVGEADALVLGWSIPDAALLHAPHLRTIVFLGTGASDHVNMQLATERGIEVHTVSGYADHAVAEHTFAILLALLRNVADHVAQMRDGEWSPSLGGQLHGSTMGLVGFGGIARAVARIARGFGMRVLVWTRSGTEEEGVEAAPLEELLSASDVVSVHLALTPETEGFISRERLALIQPEAVLVNTARGALVDEEALLEALNTESLSGAALDVFADEPLRQAHPLASHPRVVATPHVGFATHEAEAELLRRGIAIAVGELTR